MMTCTLNGGPELGPEPQRQITGTGRANSPYPEYIVRVPNPITDTFSGR